MSILSAFTSGSNIQAVADALLADCSTILFKYASFPGSCHADNAKYVLADIENSRDKHGEINSRKVAFWADHIARHNFSIATSSPYIKESDGPAELATCENLRNLILASPIQ